VNHPNKLDFEEKTRRIRAFLVSEGYDAMLLARRDNFGWMTLGGDSTVVRYSPQGAGVLLITLQRIYLAAQYMDCARIMDDELAGLEVEPVSVFWHEDPPAVRAVKLTPGRVVSDIPCPGCDARPDEIRALHLPYTQWDIAEWEALGRMFDERFLMTANQVEPGMTEQQAAALLSRSFEEAGVTPAVLLVGSDERLLKYRHPLPSEKRIEKTVLLHLVGLRGRCAAVTRMVSFGPAPERLLRDYELLNTLQADAFSCLIPGKRHGAVLERRRQLLERAGRSGEYDRHYPGADIDFFLGSPAPFLRDDPVRPTQCYDIYLTLTGCKVEELAMAGAAGARLLSTGFWPTKRYQAGAYSCRLPVILQR